MRLVPAFTTLTNKFELSRNGIMGEDSNFFKAELAAIDDLSSEQHTVAPHIPLV
jgi:hypothetical protein